MLRIYIVLKVLRIFFVISGFLFFTFFSQSKDKNKVEKIEVTGSRIKRIDLESFSPVTIFTKEDLDKSGYLSLSEFIVNTSLSNFGGTSIHNRSTLTLVDGNRLVYDGALNLIPLSAIERVEILRDGASALYGSDVVGGVINIITKKKIQSPEISLKIAPTFYKGGNQMEAGSLYGMKFKKGYFLNVLQFQYEDSIKASDRDKWYKPIYVQGFSPYPVFRVGRQFIVDPRCPEEQREQTRCKYDVKPHSYISDKAFDISTYNYLEYKLNSNGLRFYTQWVASLSGSSQPDGIIFGNLQVPAGHKMSQATGSKGGLQHIFEGLSRELREGSIILDSLIGLKGYISKTWDWDFKAKWSHVWNSNTLKGFPYLEDLTQAVFSGAYDPFDPKRRDLSAVRLYDALYKDHDLKLFSSLDFSGETGFWDIDLALGLQAYYNRYKNTADSEVKKEKIFALRPSESGTLKRNVIAFYAEAVKNFSEKLEIQLAGRVDRYSDFGWTANPKLALYFRPNSKALFRYSFGTSFEAPSLESLYIKETKGFMWIYDTVACYNELKRGDHFSEIYKSLTDEKGLESQEEKDKMVKEFLIDQSYITDDKKLSENIKTAYKNLAGEMGNLQNCQSQAFDGLYKGNKDIKETRAFTNSLGFHWQIYENHSLTADYWWNSLSGFPLNSFDSKKTIDAELRHGKEYVEQQGIQYERDSDDPDNKIKNPVSQPINIAGKVLSGLDIKWESDFSHLNLFDGNLYFEYDLSYILRSRIETFPGMGFTSNIGRFIAPRWRGFATFGWKSRRHDISLVLKSSAGVKKSNNEFESLPISNLVDLFYQYIMSEKTRFNFGLRNLLFSNPVLDDSIKEGRGFNGRLFDARGSYLFAELRKNF